MKHHELTSEQWALIEPLLPPVASTGRQPKDRRLMLNGILWILRTGVPWRDIPERFGRWRTVYGYLQQWRANCAFDRILLRQRYFCCKSCILVDQHTSKSS